MSGVPIQLSGDALYMSSTLIKAMLFIPWHPISFYWGGGDIESHGLSISLHRVWIPRKPLELKIEINMDKPFFSKYYE